jgi:hypothetical protein
MTPKALTALKASIAHWETESRRTSGNEVRLGTKYCELCLVYRKEGHCMECPIAEKTGAVCCDGTPYEDVVDKLFYWQDNDDDTSAGKGFRAEARKMLDFLKDLLPEDV